MAKILLFGETDSEYIYPTGQVVTKEDLCRTFGESTQKHCRIFFNNEIFRTFVVEQGYFIPEKDGNYIVTFADPSDETFSGADFIEKLKETYNKSGGGQQTAAGTNWGDGVEEARPFGSGKKGDAFVEMEKQEEEESIEYTDKKLQFLVYHPNIVSAIEFNCPELTNEQIKLDSVKEKKLCYDSLILTSLNHQENEVKLLLKAVREYRPRYRYLCLEMFTSYQVSRLVLSLKPLRVKIALKNVKEKLGTEIVEIVKLSIGLVCNRESSYDQFLEYLRLHRSINLDFGLEGEVWAEWSSNVIKDWFKFEGNMKLYNHLTLSTRNLEAKFELERIIPAMYYKNITKLLQFLPESLPILQSLPWKLDLEGKQFYLLGKENKPEERILLVHSIQNKKQVINIRGANFWLKFLNGLAEEMDVPYRDKEITMQRIGNTRRVCNIYDHF